MLLQPFVTIMQLCVWVIDAFLTRQVCNRVNRGLSLTRTSGVHSPAGQFHIYSAFPLLPPNSILVMKSASSPPATFKLGLIQLRVE